MGNSEAIQRLQWDTETTFQKTRVVLTPGLTNNEIEVRFLFLDAINFSKKILYTLNPLRLLDHIITFFSRSVTYIASLTNKELIILIVCIGLMIYINKRTNANKVIYPILELSCSVTFLIILFSIITLGANISQDISI